MNPGFVQRLARKATASLLSAAIVLMAPGPSSYQAVAAQFGSRGEGLPSREAKLPPQVQRVEGFSAPVNFQGALNPVARPLAAAPAAPAAPQAPAPAPRTVLGSLKQAVSQVQGIWKSGASAAQLKIKSGETFGEDAAGRPSPAVSAGSAKVSWVKRISLAVLSPAVLAAPALAKTVPAAHAAAAVSGGAAVLPQTIAAGAMAAFVVAAAGRLLNWDPAAQPSAKNTASVVAMTLALTPALIHILPPALTVTQALVSAGALLGVLKLWKKPASPAAAQTAKPVEAAPIAEAPAPAALPKGFEKFPAEAREWGAGELLKAKAEAQARARRVAKDAQLVRVTINLDDPRSHWTFVFQSKSKKKILTVWQKKIGVKALPKGGAAPVLWDSRLAKVSGLAASYAALKAGKSRFKPVRVELVAAWKGDASYVFSNAGGKEVKIPGAAQAVPTPVPASQPPARAPPAQVAAAQAAPQPAAPQTYVREDFWGFRWIEGLGSQAKLAKLSFSATTTQIIDQISRQFGIPREKVLAMAQGAGLTEASSAKDWYAVYNRLQAANEAMYREFDHRKHKGEAAVENYEGGAGIVRAVVKAALWPARFIYRLFDSFVLHYFRQSWSFEFLHKTEDFLDLAGPGRAEQALAAAFERHQAVGAGRLGGIAATRWGLIVTNAIHISLAPLASFTWRRLTMAVMSKIVMGMIAAVAIPVTSLVGFHVLAVSVFTIPILGTIAHFAADSFPWLIEQVPFIGHFAAPVVEAMETAFLQELKVERLLQTYVLSFFMTLTGQGSLKDMARAPARLVADANYRSALFSQVWSTFKDMMIVGSEIGGVLGLAGGLDGVAESASMKLTGHHWVTFKANASHEKDMGLIRGLASTIEGSQKDSILPTGGAISWGNGILGWMELQAGQMTGHVFGLDLADGVMHALDVSHRTARMHAQTVIGLASHQPGAPDYKFDPEIYKKSSDEMAARIKGLGENLGKELQAVKEHLAGLHGEQDALPNEIKELRAKGSGVTRAERAELKKLEAELAARREDRYVQGKLAQWHDLKDAKAETARKKARLQELRDIEKDLNKILAPRTGDKAGQADALGVRNASLKALAQRFKDFQNGGSAGQGPTSTVDQALAEKIGKQVDEIEKIRGEAQLQMQTRDASRQLLALTNKELIKDANIRRDGKAEQGLHVKMSRWAAAVDFSLVLNEINAGITLDQQLIDLNNKVRDQIDAAGGANTALQTTAANGLGQNQASNQAINNQIAQDQLSQNDMQSLQGEAVKAVQHITAFQSGVPQAIAEIGAGYKGFTSHNADPAAEFQYRLNLLSQVVQWRTHGNPATNGQLNDPNAINMDEIKSKLAEVTNNLNTVITGQYTLDHTDPINWGPIINAAPGGDPNDVFHSTLPDGSSYPRLLENVAAHKVYWQGKLADEQKQLDSITRMLGGVDSKGAGPGAVADEFGDTHPESLSAWRAQSKSEETAAQAQFTADVSGAGQQRGLDQLAEEVNTILHLQGGSAIPMLGGVSLANLPDALTNYGNILKAVNVPSSSDPNIQQAQFDLIDMARLLPDTGWQVIVWSRDDAIVKQIDDAVADTLPVAQSKLGGVVSMLKDVVKDDDIDTAVVKNAQNGGGVDVNAIVSRKAALLAEIKTALEGAQTLLADNGPLQTFQQKSINSAQAVAGNDLYKLFNGELTLINAGNDLFNKTMPWALASHGAPYGSASQAKTSVDAWKARLNNNIKGYDDAQGHHEGLLEAQEEIKHRRGDSNYAETEQDGEGKNQTPYLQDPNYPGGGPYSLPRKVTLYTNEMAQRANEINTQDARVNQIVAKLWPMLNGKYGPQPQPLPTDISSANPDRVQALVDSNAIKTLGDLLTTIGKDAAAQATGVKMGDLNGSTIPTGPQPMPTVDDYSKEALLALQSGMTLVPGSQTTPQSPSAAYSVARFLYAKGVLKAANDAMTPVTGQLDKAQAFVTEGMQAVGFALSAAEQDRSYVNSVAANPNGETAQSAAAVYARQLDVFNKLQAFLADGVAFMGGQKLKWDKDAFNTLSQVNTYYNSLQTISGSATTLNASELQAWQRIDTGLRNEMDALQKKKNEILGYLGQLQNKPAGQDKSDDSALREVGSQISMIQDQTKAVLKDDVLYQSLKKELGRSDEILKADLGRLQEKQDALAAELEKLVKDPSSRGKLPPALVERLEKLRVDRGMWAMGNAADGAAPQSFVIRKSEFSTFLDGLLRTLNPQETAGKIDLLKQDLLNNPQNLSALLPGAQLLDFTDTADGFYMVYQSQFGVPHGLETKNWATLGNLFKVGGSNVSVIGYQFASPPAGDNAPYGDKGIEVQIESLDHDHWVNYLNIDFHRYALDIPPDTAIASQGRESRVLLFDDYAVMLFGDKLYVGLAGLGDMAATDIVHPRSSPEKPYYYGGSLQSSIKMKEWMSLDTKQQQLFSKDPRTFMQQANLDFTGFDDARNQTFTATAGGKDMHYWRSEVGPSLNVARLINSDGQGGDSFTMDLFFANSGGTEDVTQKSVGARVLKGFTLTDNSGKVWKLNNTADAELGEKFDTYADHLSVELPYGGIALNGEGKIIGTAKALYGEASRKVGDHSTVALGYGSQFVNNADRLSLKMNTSFTLGEIWQKVVDKSAEDLKGGKALAGLNQKLGDFYKSGSDPASVKKAELLKRLWEESVARRLISQKMGGLTSDIEDLRGAGSFLDKTRVQGTVGVVSRPVGTDTADRAVGGGFVVGTNATLLNLGKTPKAMLDKKIPELVAEGARLQEAIPELTKEFQSAVAALAQAQWDMKLADYMVKNAPDTAVEAEAGVMAAEAASAYHQALHNFNSLTFRGLEDPSPFDDFNTGDFEALREKMRGVIAAPDSMGLILHSLDESELTHQLGEKNPFNLMDWIPWVENLSVSVGVQLQDLAANQQFTTDVSLKLPIWKPGAQDAAYSYTLQGDAARKMRDEIFARERLAHEKEFQEAQVWGAEAQALRPRLPEAAQDLAAKLQAFRNGVIGPKQLQEAFATWRRYADQVMEADSRAALSEAQAATDASLGGQPPARDPQTLTVSSLNDVFEQVNLRSHSVKEIALREKAAEALAKADNHRIVRAYVDLHLGTDLTAAGAGWLPAVGVTGVSMTPILGFDYKPEDLRVLEVAQDRGDEKSQRLLKADLEISLAAKFYQNGTAFEAAQRGLEAGDRAIAELEKSGAKAEALDDARHKRAELDVESREALATLNYLLGRSADSPLEVKFDPKEGLESLDRFIAAKVAEVSKDLDAGVAPSLAALRRQILRTRVDIAQAHQRVVDYDLSKKNLAGEPISIGARYIGGIIHTLKDGDIGSPEKMQAALNQTRAEVGALERFDQNRKAEVAQARAALARANDELAHLPNKGDEKDPVKDAQNDAKRDVLAGRVFELKAGLLSLGADPDAGPEREYAPAPKSFTELQNRLARAEQDLSAKPSRADLDTSGLEPGEWKAAAFYRRFYARQTLGMNPIRRWYNEGWLEVRLKSQDTPREARLKLAKLSEQKADRQAKNDLAGASALGEILTVDFQTNVRMLRWAQSVVARSPAAARQGDFAEFIQKIEARLGEDRGRIVALLDLSPETTLAQLEAVVPDDSSGAKNLRALSQNFLQEIKAKRLDLIRATLFEGGLPRSFGNEDDLMHQIRADTIARQMSYKGFTPVLAMGLFRGQNILGGFLQAPDPRAIEKGLENVLSDALRRQLEATGEMQTLTLHLHQLMSRVEDGGRQLEKRRVLVEKAEDDLKAQLALAGGDGKADEVVAAQERVIQAWIGFADQMVQTKGDFISLVTELEALQVEKPRDLSALGAIPSFPSLRDDPTAETLSYWTGRFLDDGFGAKMDEEFERLGPAVPAELTERVRQDAETFRSAKSDQEAVLHKDFDAAEKLDLLARNDLEGKREALEADLAMVLRALETPLPMDKPRKPELLAFLNADMNEQAGQSDRELTRHRETAQALRKAYWDALPAGSAVDGAYDRLEGMKNDMDAARQGLLQDYLEDPERKPEDFILTDMALDRYLKAQQAFDGALVKVAGSDAVRHNAGAAWGLDGLYDMRGALSRRIEGERSGRGMLALDALIMLEESRLSAARWEGRPPQELEAVALSLQRLKDRKEAWEGGAVELAPLYAKLRVSPAEGKSSGTAEWLTRDRFQALKASGQLEKVSGPDGDRYYLSENGARYELVAGVDAREADRDGASRAAAQNAQDLGRFQSMKDHDFAVDGAAPGEPRGYSYDEVLGPQGFLHQDGGRLYFFEASKADEPAGRVHKSLNPLSALRLKPEDSVLYVYKGDNPPARDRFPTLESLRSSGRDKEFRLLVMGQKGAAQVVDKAREGKAAEQGAGWLETKLNSYGFARDEKGTVVKLYQTKDAFKAERKAFADAESTVKAAEKAAAKAGESAAKAAAEKDRLKADLEKQTAAYAAVEKEVRQDAEAAVPKAGSGLEEARRKIGVEKRVAQDKRFRQAKKELEPYSKKFNKALDAYKLIEARLDNAQAALRAAYEIRDHAKAWSLYDSGDLLVKWDGASTVLSVRGDPVYGKQKLDETLAGGGPGGGGKELRGEILAVIMDDKGRVKRAITEESEFDSAAGNEWVIKSVEFKPDQKVDAQGRLVPQAQASSVNDDGLTVSPTFRLSHYEVKATGDRVLLSRRYLIERAQSAQSKVWRLKHAWLMPWNLGSLALELPRSLAGIPLELATGRDPAQQHYRGRMNMSMLEGGATEHHGFFRKAAGVVDILDFLPDKVERYYDPSQFPAQVKLDSPIRPGEDILSKDMREVAPVKGCWVNDNEHPLYFPKDMREGAPGKDVHFGVLGAETRLTYSMEDLTTAVERTLSHFNGGVEETLVDEARGRAGSYQESVRKGASGRESIDRTLEDPLIANDPRSDGSDDVVISATPGSLAGGRLDFGAKADRIQKQVRVRVGAAQYGEEIDAVSGYSDRLAADAKAAEADRQKLADTAARTEGALKEGTAARERGEDSADAVAARYHELAQSISSRDGAFNRRLARLENRLAELPGEIGKWNDYLKKVEDAVPSNPLPPAPQPLPLPRWHWTVLALALAVLLALLKGRILGQYARIRQGRP